MTLDNLEFRSNIQFRKLAKSKNFDIITDEGRYEIEMDGFGMPKYIIDGDYRRNVNSHSVAKKYREEIKKYISAQ
tara:strand:+ start:5711 stop:5935 length:225 start_codon:yes stop_codon:yes gene_type:complete